MMNGTIEPERKSMDQIMEEMQFRRNDGTFDKVSMHYVLEQLEFCYTTWRYIHGKRQGIEQVDGLIRESVDPKLKSLYYKNQQLMDVMRRILAIAMVSGEQIHEYAEGRLERDKLKDVDGSPLLDFDLGLVMEFNKKIYIGKRDPIFEEEEAETDEDGI
ncbi:hypothetical protein KY340_00215 [Candidatus Woesearchaeota archaeon]|nr:hypothetical protein [Candidatus Woesearchaeota archaeon]